MNAPKTLKIDFVSDVVCPWCAIGLSALEIALQKLEGEVAVELHFQPFELHPDMGPEGAEVVPYLSKKYGMSADQVERNQQMIAERGAAVGFEFRMDRRSRTYNTFDAHRLLHWAALEAPQRQLSLKRALLVANFSEGRDIGNHEVLAEVAAGVGLDAARAREVLASGAFANEVREAEEFFRRNGINSVPAVIIEKKHLVSGGQPPEVFERALREIAAAP